MLSILMALLEPKRPQVQVGGATCAAKLTRRKITVSNSAAFSSTFHLPLGLSALAEPSRHYLHCAYVNRTCHTCYSLNQQILPPSLRPACRPSAPVGEVVSASVAKC